MAHYHELLWHFSQGLGGFTAIVPEEIQDTAKARLFSVRHVPCFHMAQPPVGSPSDGLVGSG